MAAEASGLIAAVFTPMHDDGQLNLEIVGEYVNYLVDSGILGLLVCGTTGEYSSLSIEERRAVAEAFADAASGRLPMMIHIGHENIESALVLAAHAAEVGAVACASGPCGAEAQDVDAIVGSFARIAGTVPGMPLLYYHIPARTGVSISVAEFLRAAADRVPTLAGVKYTSETLDEYVQCVEEFCDQLMLFGRDEMLLGAIAMGATCAVGSSYNFAAPLYQRMWEAFRTGDVAAARRCQCRCSAMIAMLKRYNYASASKSCMKLVGIDCGPPRPPIPSLDVAEQEALWRELDGMGFDRTFFQPRTGVAPPPISTVGTVGE